MSLYFFYANALAQALPSDARRVLLLEILSAPKPPATVAAIDFLFPLDKVLRTQILNGTLDKSSKVLIGYAELNDPTKGDLAPTLEDFQSFFIEENGKKLTTSIAGIL